MKHATMKRLITSLIILFAAIGFARAQVLPTFQFGLKGGINVSSLESSASATFSTSNRAGYLGGIWARFGAVGFNFQPEMYLTSKDVSITTQGGGTTSANFTS